MNNDARQSKVWGVDGSTTECGVRKFWQGAGLAMLLLGLTAIAAHGQSDRVVITEEDGYSIEWDGNNGAYDDPEIGAGPPDNAALASNGTTAFGSSEFVPGPETFHGIVNVNDGFYSNSSSWIPNFQAEPPDPNPFIGLNFGREVTIESVAWSRDNGDDAEPAGGVLTDRAVGAYTLQITRSDDPDENTEETGDASSGWETIGSVEYLEGESTFNFSAHLRHRFDVGSNGEGIPATGLRIKVSEPTMAIDEIEVNPGPDPVPPISEFIAIESEEGYAIGWDGNSGNFSDSEAPAAAPENRASSERGTVAFASSTEEATNRSVDNLNDGLYGDEQSWSAVSEDNDPFIGLAFGETIELNNVAWSRDNGNDQEGPANPNIDRALGEYTLQVTTVEAPSAETEVTGDPSTGWVTVGQVSYKMNGEGFQSFLRHRFDIATTDDEAIEASGLRVQLSDSEIVIDELEVNVSPLIEQNLISVEGEGNFSVDWDGNDGDFFDTKEKASAPDNAALASKGAVAFASGVLAGFPDTHAIAHVNDGLYGNSNSWIPGAEDDPPFIGIRFGETVEVSRIAWGRDNGNTVADACGGQCTDRSLGEYVIQITRVSSPGADTTEASDPDDGWVTVGTVAYNEALEPEFRPWRRHEYAIAQNGDAIPATGIRIKVPNNGTAIDEIEVNPSALPPSPVLIASEGDYAINWDGNSGDFSAPDEDASAPRNAALDATVTAFSSSDAESDLHQAAYVRDGLYGNSRSWSPATGDQDPYVGLDFGGAVSIGSIAFGRDNGNDSEGPADPNTDGAVGVYTLQVTSVPSPGSDTTETGDASTGWITIGTIELSEGSESAELNPYLRHRFEIELAGEPISATGLRLKVPNDQTVIDELEVNPLENLAISEASGFSIIWDGNEGEFNAPEEGAGPPENAALADGVEPFGSSEFGVVHFVDNINDGLYGNNESWIANFAGDPPDPDPFVGLDFGQEIALESIAWGRDNGNDEADACGGLCTDRSVGSYTIQITTVADPGVETPEADDPNDGWVTVGTLEYLGNGPNFTPWLRHRFDLAQDSGAIQASGLRIKVSSNQIAIDEIEINSPRPAGSPSLNIARSGDEITISWEGDGVLERSEDIPGPWSEVADAESPHVISVESEGRRFFRLRR